MSGLILAAPASGTGKTVTTSALLRALNRRGVHAAPAKAGPDYIDAAFLTAAAGRECRNLDLWAMRPATLAGAVAALEKSDIALCEGVMGLYDGIGARGEGSTAELARLTGWPVILVVDASGIGASIAALIEGYARHAAAPPIAGIILNRVGSAAHRALLAEALAGQAPLLGALPRQKGLLLPSRHLGLVQAQEHAALEQFFNVAADLVEAHIDLKRLVALAQPARIGEARDAPPLAPLGQRIAVARDAVFAFAYPALLAGWRAAGAEISFFSPLEDQSPTDCDAIYLPGGYPELHAGKLAAATHFRAGLARLAARGAVIYGECGGYMVLGESLIDGSGAPHAMAGLLPLVTSFSVPRLHLGYRSARLENACALGRARAVFRGHEFHYASIVEEGAGAPLFALADAKGASLGSGGRIVGSVMGSFLHLVDRAD